jgi:hypothetical protein
VLAEGGASDRFGSNVGHSIHSITVQHLQEFEPNVTVNNTIPTVDMDLRAEWPIRLNAPDMAGSSLFKTNAMQTLDQTLSHMDNKDYDVKYFTILERIVHTFHMQEVWFMSREYYNVLKKSPPSTSFCRCARDVDNNNVMKMLRFSALAMREPALVYGQDSKDQYVKYVQYSVTYHFGANNKVDAKGPLNPNSVLLSVEDSMPALVDEASWAQWKKILLNMDPSTPKDLALYLYCALRD